MATGELTRHGSGEVELGPGEAITSSGRISAARMYEPAAPIGPFNTPQLARLDEALTFASRETGLDFSVYLGELGQDSRASAEALHAGTDNPANSVRLACSYSGMERALNPARPGGSVFAGEVNASFGGR